MKNREGQRREQQRGQYEGNNLETLWSSNPSVDPLNVHLVRD